MKITYKKTRKNNISKKNKKAGFFSRNKVAPSGVCDPNNLANLTKVPQAYDQNSQLKPLEIRINDLSQAAEKLHSNYLSCCPKNFMGQKNSSPYCKQLDTSFKSMDQHRRDITGYYGDETNVSEIKRVMNEPVPNPVMVVNPTGTKSKWKFWAGKKTRKSNNKKRSYRRK